MTLDLTRFSSTLAPAILAAALAAAFLSLGGCASGSSTQAAPATPERAAAPAVPTNSTEPLDANAVTLAVKGLSCPQCASNIDRTLGRVEGVRRVQVDLAAGRINLELAGKVRPSPARLARAVSEAGFSIDSITINQPAGE